MYQRQCKWCGKDYEATRPESEFHNGACKQAYWRWKHDLDLERARSMRGVWNIYKYTAHSETGVEAWEDLVALRDWLNGLLISDPWNGETDPV